MDVNYIIIQAGGKGTRLEHLTKNKPKALVPVFNLPMIFHLFHKYPDKKFVIIADYQKDVLRRYLECFAEAKYCVVDSIKKGTCGGISQALEKLPCGEPFMLMWSDLILSESFKVPVDEANYIGISESFKCRWSYENGTFSEKVSAEHGVAGLFVFKDKSILKDIPQEGEFVRWLQQSKIPFSELGLKGTCEFGILEEYKCLQKTKTRPFNKMEYKGDIIIKEAVDSQGKQLAERECNWYRRAIELGITAIPRIYSYAPLKMQRIHGMNVYEYRSLCFSEKKNMLSKLVNSLKEMHALCQVPADFFSIREAYYTKTMERLRQVRDLIPFTNRETIVVNGRVCRNVFFYERELEYLLDQIPCETFQLIHGDCTFSNIMIGEDGNPIFIDPRGYFGFTEIVGDPNYDWAKLYYSLYGNYDYFNMGDFQLNIDSDHVELSITSGGWEEMQDEYFKMIPTSPEIIKLLHAIIWLSLTTYAWHDYDSICGAFYNGLYYLEEIL